MAANVLRSDRRQLPRGLKIAPQTSFTENFLDIPASFRRHKAVEVLAQTCGAIAV